MGVVRTMRYELEGTGPYLFDERQNLQERPFVIDGKKFRRVPIREYVHWLAVLQVLGLKEDWLWGDSFIQ